MEVTSANVWVGKNRFERRTLPLPEPPEQGLLLEVTANGICGTDVHLVGQDPTAAMILGHEIVGRIVAFGPGHPHTDAEDQPLREGDTVALFPWVPCLTCWSCRRFGPGATTCSEPFVYGVPPEAIGLTPCATDESLSLTGGFGRHLAVRPGTYLWRVPQSLSPAVASLLDPLAVAVRCVDLARTAPGAWDEVLTPDATAVVLGAGAIGLLTSLALRQVGVGTVVVSGSRPGRLEVARELGIDRVMDIGELGVDERRRAVHDMTGGRGADLVIDATNSPAALSEALAMVRRLGTVIEVGNIVPTGSSITVDPARDICQRSVRLLGVSFNPPRSYTEGMALLARNGSIPFERLITRSFSFDDIGSALEALGGDAVKVTLTV
ncbi:hypothetical protein AAW14_24985 [Streptomyces hygroscopicus]|uniref:zinc-dependent alcohol dehydrogenase n=1 Tax=Streptomyces hygroscopicus TaxID=1912 RepID=UPI00224088F3|nr:zinc-binding dehydrogenase [Streptomyces hygroscopicus]MCW7945173.1 hypothetical protein [Streptomyces hygroscopicus]